MRFISLLRWRILFLACILTPRSFMAINLILVLRVPGLLIFLCFRIRGCCCLGIFSRGQRPSRNPLISIIRFRRRLLIWYWNYAKK